jgi:gamma-glutamyltranspeptidase/glutathione hydrolase
VLQGGGNAIDAAVASVFAVGVTRPELCGIGGGGFLVHRRADGVTAALDFRETAPSTYTFSRGLFPTPDGGAIGFGTGHGVVGAPGTVAGLATALGRFGTRPLAELLAPAERLARDGIVVTPEQASHLRTHQPRLLLYPAAARIYLRDGVAPYAAGERIVQPDYAASLRAIADGGPGAFYEGPIAQAIVRDMAASGTYPGDRGTLAAKDLAAYRAVWRGPVRTTYRGHTVIAMPPPTSGGLAIVETLNLLEGFDLPGAGPGSADAIHLMAEAQKIAWADRNAYVGDPGFVNVPVAELASKAYADARRAEIALERAGVYGPGLRSGTPRGRGGDHPAAHTTHVSVVDRHGSAVAVTCTIEQIFGSAVVAPGTGFLLNNQLTDFGSPGTANAPAPGKRPRSSTSPTIVARGERALLAVGGSGGPAIIGGVVSALVGLTDFGRDVARAVDAERSDARGVCRGPGLQLCLEDARVRPQAREELARRGHQLQGLGNYAPGPRVQAVGVDPATGEALATSDPRNELGSGFEAGRGGLAEPGVAPRSGPVRVRVLAARRLSPRRIRLRLRVTARRGATRERVLGALVRVGDRRVRTDPAGAIELTARAPRPVRVRVDVPGLRRVEVLVRR